MTDKATPDQAPTGVQAVTVELSADDLRAVRHKTARRLIRHIWDIQYADDAGIADVCAAIRGTADRIESLNRRIVELDTQGRLL